MNKIILQLNDDHHRSTELFKLFNEQFVALDTEASSPTADPVFGPVVMERYGDVRNCVQQKLK